MFIYLSWHVPFYQLIIFLFTEAGSSGGSGNTKRVTDGDVFPGFKPAIEACQLDWSDYPLPGVTYSRTASRYYCPVMCFRHDSRHESQAAPISAPHPRNPTSHAGPKRPSERRVLISPGNPGDHENLTGGVPLAGHRHSGHRSSSVSSEGFCDNDIGRDSDSPPDQRSPEQVDSGQVSRQSSREERPMAALGLVVALGRSRDDHDKSSPDDGGVESDWSGVAEPTRPQRSRGGSRGQRSRDLHAADEYDLYLYNANMIGEGSSGDGGIGSRGAEIFSNIKKLEDPLEILFARAEGLHAHGHLQEASELAVQLSHELLANPPNLMIDLPPPPSKGKRKKVNPASHHLTCLASATLGKCAFLCTVLAENPEHTHLAFQVAMFGLEMARPPASTKVEFIA